MKRVARLKKLVTSSGGSQIAEAALVMPIVFLLFLGIFWFGRAFNIYATINHAAREGARLAATNSCALCGNVDFSTTSSDPVGAVVTQALQASKLDPKQVSLVTPTFCTCGNTSCSTPVPCATNLSAGQPQICVQYDVQLNPSAPTPGSCGVSVAFRYPYQAYLPFTSLNLEQIYLPVQVQAKSEQ